MLVNLNDVLTDAKKNKYAVGLFNAVGTQMLQAIIEAAEEERSPIIFGTGEAFLPYGELKLIAPSFVDAAKRAKVPVVLHFDHGLTFEKCMEALSVGFTSIMYDGSTKPYPENISNTREIVKIAKCFGASVEGEIGHVGGDSSETGADGSERYTTVKEAVDYAADTGVDALAIAIGTAHGNYTQKPELDINRLKEISKAVKIPLVLHGGSGLSDDDFKDSIKNGISKINIFTDIMNASERAMRAGLEKNKFYLDIGVDVTKAVKEEVRRKLRLFGSCGRA